MPASAIRPNPTGPLPRFGEYLVRTLAIRGRAAGLFEAAAWLMCRRRLAHAGRAARHWPDAAIHATPIPAPRQTVNAAAERCAMPSRDMVFGDEAPTVIAESVQDADRALPTARLA